MGKVIWAPSALSDIESIAEYIQRDSVDQASLFVTRIIEMTDRLERFPYSGRVIPEMDNEYCREIVYGAYRIMYRLIKEEIWITGVIHGARNWHSQEGEKQMGLDTLSENERRGLTKLMDIFKYFIPVQLFLSFVILFTYLVLPMFGYNKLFHMIGFGLISLFVI